MMLKYRSAIFDCDGVILNSNRVKTDAFYKATLPYGKQAAEKMVAHHVANGGISRYEKFAFFLEKIAPKYASSLHGPDLNELLRNYADVARSGLMSCDIAPSLQKLRTLTPNVTWFIVSGGDQIELREVFESRGLQELFNGGIYGSPDDKKTILTGEIDNNNIVLPGIFLGDSRVDYEAAKSSGLDFIFVSKWTEFKEWRKFCSKNNISTIETLSQLIT